MKKITCLLFACFATLIDGAPSEKDKKTYQPFFEAIQSNSSITTWNYLRKGFDPEVQDEYGNAGLHKAVQYTGKGVLNALLKRTTNPNIQNKEGETPLYAAVFKGNNKAVQLLLNHENIDPNIKSFRDDTALHLAASHGNKKAIKLLLQHEKTDPSITNKQGNNALFEAAVHDFDTTKLLLQKGKFDLEQSDLQGNNILHIAAKQYDKNLVKHLLKQYELNPNVQNNDNDTPLHLIVKDTLNDTSKKKNFKKTAKLLLAYNADPHLRNKEGKSPLDLAIEAQNKQMIDILEQKKGMVPIIIGTILTTIGMGFLLNNKTNQKEKQEDGGNDEDENDDDERIES